MKTEVAIDGTRFLVNGKPPYEGVSHEGRLVEGLLLNTRMIQAIFDDENPETATNWKYPDTGEWDPDRNTREFCEHLPEYVRHGILAVTVGLQGGGSIYAPGVYDKYVNSAFGEDGSLKDAYFDRLERVLRAADEIGMVVIVNYFYWKQVERIPDEVVTGGMIEAATERLLKTGYRNILVDLANEAGDWWKRPLFGDRNVHKLVQMARSVEVDGRRLLVSTSTGGDNSLPSPEWMAAEDFHLPHGNGCTPDELRAKIRAIRDFDDYRKRPCPVIVNEDCPFVPNLEAAVDEYCSWGYYSQGAGSREKIYDDVWGTQRENEIETLSGFQTLPVNWGINTDEKKAFFGRVKEIAGGQ